MAGETINGTVGDDTLSGRGGADTINSGDGNDILYGHSAGATGVITAVRIAQGLSQPVAASAAPGDPGFLYVVEKASGIIHRVDVATGARTTFLDIPNGEFSADSERGVLGIAFHPQYASNGRYFVFLTDTAGDLQVREYHRSANPTVSDTTFSVIWETPHPGASNHNGGWIAFSPVDGYLYIGTGDGGGGGDPNNNAQNLNSFLGKILRIDVNGPDAYPSDPNLNYAIPANNPFVGVTGADEIWAYGVRNPWRNAFDPRDGSLYLADVGQSAREEVSFLTATQAGANLGWRIMEGDIPYNPGPPGTPQPGDPSLINPVYAYPRSLGTSITGGEVYMGPNADFVGQYVFADFGSGRFFTLQVVNGAAVDVAERTAQIVSATGALSSIVEFATDSNGALYAIGIGGQIWRLDMGVGAEDVGDTLNGGAGNDALDGNIGADTMSGGTGNDTYFVGESGDVVIEQAGEGQDTVYTSITYTLPSNVEEGSALGSAAINLFGNGLTNLLVGNGAVNGLDGGAGADTLIGGGGNDVYIVDNIADVVIETSGGGSADVIYTSLAFYQLGDNVEQLSVTAATGTYAVGNGLNNLIVGNAGADALDGGAGADTLVGGAGNDSYFVDNVADVIIETAGAGAADVVYASLAFYQLGDNVEQLSVTAATGTYAVGNSSNNLIVGNAGADALDGGAGADTLVGGAGNDSYFADNVADVIIEVAGEGSADVIYTSLAFYQLGDNVEQLSVTAASGTYAVGNGLNNLIVGNSGADALEGRGGGDVLVGGGGADTFIYNNASEGGDAITDFVSGVDNLRFSAAGFGGGLINGANAPFVSGSTPTSVGASFLYDTDDGRLFWDSDGAGGAAAVLIATLSGAPALTQSDIIIGP